MNVENQWEETASDSPAESNESEPKAETAVAETAENELPGAEPVEAQAAGDEPETAEERQPDDGPEEPETAGEQQPDDGPEEPASLAIAAFGETVHEEEGLPAEKSEPEVIADLEASADPADEEPSEEEPSEEDDLFAEPAEEAELVAENEPEVAAQASAEEPSADLQPVKAAEIDENITATSEEIRPVIEALLFVADEPLPFKQLCKVLGDVREDDVNSCLEELVSDYNARNSGLEVREIAGGWRISTRPQNHEFIRKYLKSRPSARLSLPALETLAVIAYKQPITIPEILEIRGVSSSSAIKTLLEKRLIVTKGRKETVGRPMMYGTSKEFMIQFGLKDLTELPSIEDFADLAQ
ncbi:MAG TPA: SMC-Scp complex subunit ScpB [Blastocatellia bacterium]|nr:SMC-Scp complex subunit ScpB [Blastocatellia bacterium]